MWKQTVIIIFLASVVTSASATTVTEENVKIDLENSRVNVELNVQELTSQDLTYFTTYRVSDIQASANGEPLKCNVRRSDIESEINCETNETKNFKASIEFTAQDIVNQEGGRKVFLYEQDFIRPTSNYSLSVTLPKGEVLVDQNNITRPVISPPRADISTNGQRIRIKWSEKPTLGETKTYRLLYEPVKDNSNNLLGPAIAIIAIISILTAIVLGARQFLRKSIEDEFESMTDDQVELVKLLKDNEGSMLQKDIVEQMDYSKAKVSGIVKELVEEDILEKKKEGRSNMLKISRKYSY